MAQVRQQMAPFERRLGELSALVEQVTTERRRRERQQQVRQRAALRAAVSQGQAVSLEELVANPPPGHPAWSELSFHLKTGGRVGLGYPGARQATVTLSDGADSEQTVDVDQAHRLWLAGWTLGWPGRPGVRVHMLGSRQERLVGAADLYLGERLGG